MCRLVPIDGDRPPAFGARNLVIRLSRGPVTRTENAELPLGGFRQPTGHRIGGTR